MQLITLVEVVVIMHRLLHIHDSGDAAGADHRSG